MAINKNSFIHVALCDKVIFLHFIKKKKVSFYTIFNGGVKYMLQP